MVAINKAEVDAIRKRYPKTYIVRTMKQRSKRHKYYCEESKQVMWFLNRLRSGESVNEIKERGYNRSRKKNKRNRA